MNKFTVSSLKISEASLRVSKTSLRVKILLVLIIALAAAVRLIVLDKFPNGFTGDEAQQGYSAYSILKTGKDEWGQFLPLNPRGFGDFKPPLYTYLTIPLMAIFDLNIVAVRLPAALIGILTVLVVYFLTKELLQKENIALWAAFLLAISPWHIQLSRTAFEAGAGILTFSLGLLFFLKSEKKKYLILTIILWGLTLYTYHSFRVLVVLFILGLFFLRKLSQKQIIYLSLGLFIFLIPLLTNWGNISTRAADVGIFSNDQVINYFKYKGTSPLPSIVDKIFDNKYLFINNTFIQNYLSYYSPSFFFTGTRSDSTYLNFPKFELLYLIEIIFWLFAGYMIIFKKIANKNIFIIWFLLAPFSAALTSGQMNANRAPAFLPLTAIISAVGVSSFIYWLNDRSNLKAKFTQIIIPVILLINFTYFLYFYFIQLPKNPPHNLRYGYDRVFKKVLEIQGNYNEIIFSKAFTEPQIFVAFYGKIDPKRFQQASQDWLRYENSDAHYIDQLPSWNFEKFLFEDISWEIAHSKRKNALVVSSPRDFSEDIKSIYDVKNSKGEILYRLVPTKNAIE